jgi:hypothetical protein
MRSISKTGAAPKTTKRKLKVPPLDIGWREWAALPDLGVDAISAKIDTGAKTSALHAFRIREIMHEGALYAEFFVHPLQRRNKPEIFCRAPIVDKRRIKSSNGVSQNRLVILTDLQMADRTWPIEVSLTNRDEMGFRFLIGRDALRKRVVIHPGKSFLLGKHH